MLEGTHDGVPATHSFIDPREGVRANEARTAHSVDMGFGVGCGEPELYCQLQGCRDRRINADIQCAEGLLNSVF